jgi:hypothetical protein
MKKIVLYLIILIAAGFYSCKEQDSVYEEYIIPNNGIVYPQRADSLKIYPGLNRVQLTWLKAKDPKVVKARIYWNNYTDSLNVDIPADKNIISVSINNLPEGTYTFHVKTFDAKGNASVPVEITGMVYGINYTLTLSSRQLSMNAYYDRVDLAWSAVANTVTNVSIRYVTSSNQTVERNISLNEITTVLTDYKPGGTITVITTYLPSPTALDPVVVTDELIFPDEYELNKATWTIVVSDSLLRSDTRGGIDIIDNDINSMWHSNLSLYYPHWFVIDMKGEKVISRLEICQNPSYIYTKTFAIKFSNDNVNWSAAVNLVFPNDAAVSARQSILFETPVTARYVRIETIDGLGKSGNNRYAMVMEVYVYGHD